MGFQKFKLENTEEEVNVISIVYSETISVDGEGCSVFTEEQICSYLTLKEANKEVERLNNTNHSPNIKYNSFCLEMKSKIECEHPYWAVSTRCMGEINKCTKCGKVL